MELKKQPKVQDHGPVFLFVISFLSLFLELLLIRWIGVEIRIFAYFRNLTLISCFLGLGIGFSLKHFRVGLLFSLLLITGLAAAVHPQAARLGVSLRAIPYYLSLPEYNIWYLPDKTTLLQMVIGYALITVVVVVLIAAFIPFGQILGDIFAASTHRIRDYSINLFGSLAGTWVFALLSYLDTPPWMWFLAGAGGMAAMIRPWSRRTIVGLSTLIAILLLTQYRDTPSQLTYWSPYQKLQLSKIINNWFGVEIPYYHIDINSVNYMLLLDLSEDQFKRFPGVFRKEDAPYYPYDLPYRFHPRPQRVLIVGAGGGNDAAAALRNGAEQVDAVEIDPVIARLGSTYHPEKPYQNPRVHLIVDDARSFFKKTRERYDLIVFALLDSHTLISNFTNINLDSYVYTRESFEEAKAHLAPGGIISLSFFVPQSRDWLGAKLYALTTEVFGRPPLAIMNYGKEKVRGMGGTLLLCGDMKSILDRAENDHDLAHALAGRFYSPDFFEKFLRAEKLGIPTDDWPYLYLRHRQIPSLYYVLIAVLLVITVLAVLYLFPAGRIGPSHFLFLGAGFMLVEVHSISKAALLFGSTWIVNVVIISAILVMILLANLLTLRYQFEKMRWWYAGIFLSLLLTYLIPVDRLLVGTYWTRGILAGAFYSLPLFFAGVIFASSIRRVLSIEGAFAANMLGAALGGMLDATSFLFGLRAVVLIALLLYLASALALRRLPLLAPGPPAATGAGGLNLRLNKTV